MDTDLSRCPNCGGDADNGHDRCYPPSPYWCTKCSEAPISPQSGLTESTLPPRFIKLLQMLADGRNLKQAAAELGICHQTARNYSLFIKDTLGADTIAQAVILGIRKGLIQ